MDRHLCALLACVPLVACSGGGDGGDAAPAPDPVTVLSDPCPSGPGILPDSTCMLLQVAPSGLEQKQVELRITEPNAGVPYLGTVVLCSAINGEVFYANMVGGKELIGDLAALGLRVVDRRWIDGWLTPGYQLKSLSERMAVLLDWIHANVHQGGAFLAVGNSGGSGELSYTLTAWNREALFDSVVLGSGPVFSRLDYLCLPPDGDWGALCPGLVPPLDCGLPPCTAPSLPFCVLLTDMSTDELVANSVLFPGADLSFGGLGLHMLVGALDCSEWVPQALLFEGALASPHTLQVVPNTPHDICETPEGRDAIEQALLGDVLAAPPGGQMRLELSVFEDAGDRGERPGDQ